VSPDGAIYPVMPQQFFISLGQDVTGLAVFKDDVDLTTYAAVQRCVIAKVRGAPVFVAVARCSHACVFIPEQVWIWSVTRSRRYC
jgi:hypothetical protein